MSERLFVGRSWTLGLYAIAFLLGIIYVAWLASLGPDREAIPATPQPSVAVAAAATVAPRPTQTPSPTMTPQATTTSSPLPNRPKIGIVAGHWQNDSGAVCSDGQQEVSINIDVSARVVAILQKAGYDAELLAEFAPQLTGYKADAFVSIHADSCGSGLSGFKVARVAHSAIPEQEDRLVACLVREYGEATDLKFHQDTITFDMTGYHAFGEIDTQTPGAIIELGFMDSDRKILTENSYEVAQGVAQGIICFIEGR